MDRSTPLFPLPDLVLFPGQVLPLYVFEQRYRDLLAQVRQSGEPFGIVRILESAEEGGRAFHERVSRVGTMAHLRSVTDHEDGTASIVVVGGERFSVTTFDRSQSFLSAAVREEPLPDAGRDDAVMQALARRLLDGLVEQRPADRATLYEHAPQTPLLMASFAAALLPLDGDQREEALRAGDLLLRLETLIGFLPRDMRTMN